MALGRDQAVDPGTSVVIATALMAIGLVAVTSTTAPLDRSLLDGHIWQTLLGRQTIYAFAALGLVLVVGRLATPWLGSRTARKWACQLLFAVALVGLVAALVPGLAEAHRGSQRWLRFGSSSTGIVCQPSEFAKLAMVAFLAWLLADRSRDPRSLRDGFLPAAAAIGVCVLLVGKEDFGTAVLLGIVGTAMLFVAGCRFRHLLFMGLAGSVGFAVLLFAAPYRLARLAAYGDVWADPHGAGYQPLQSLVAISSGGWFGTGLGAGVQKYGYLPASQSDFIFASICEETGVLGGWLVIALFCTLIWIGVRTMWSAGSSFERLLAFGITALVGLQAAMNIAVVTVVAPTTGISLPLVSAGGSGLMVFGMAIGLLSAIARRGRTGVSSEDAAVGSPIGEARAW